MLRFTHPHGGLDLLVDEPVLHCALPVAAFRPLPPLLAARLRLPCIKTLACITQNAQEALLILLDPWLLALPDQAPGRSSDRNGDG